MKVSYNTTFVMPPQLEAEFLAFMREVYVPGILAQGVLSRPEMRRIVSHEEGVDALSIALSFIAESHEVLSDYLQQEGHVYPEQLLRRFGEQVLGFTTLMEHIELH